MDDKTFIEIIKWLYTNHGEFDSGSEWRAGLVEFLMSKRDRVTHHTGLYQEGEGYLKKCDYCDSHISN